MVAYLEVSKMELSSHYIEFVTNDKHSSIGNCVSCLMTMLHGFMRHNKCNIGVSFPNMSDNFIGDKVRVFGSPEQLTQVLNNHQIQNACKRSICSLSVYIPTRVPTDKKAIRYIAARDVGKKISTLFKQKTSRFTRRHGHEMAIGAQQKLKLHLVNKAQELPYFTVKNEKGLYPIHINKAEIIEKGEFNSFGLGNQGGSVYDF